MSFRDFAESTFLPTFGNSNAPAQVVGGHTSQPATESAATGASELHRHQWLRPDNGTIECATCDTARNYYGE